MIDAKDRSVEPPLQLLNPTILIVEDESIVAMDLEGQLEDIGYEVCGISDNGHDAIERAARQRPHLVLMDVVIKGDMDGIETAEEIRRMLNIPVVFLTAYSDKKTVERAVSAAPYGYLTKPFQIKEIRAAIEVALYKATLEKQLRDSEQWFASTLRCVADGVIATDSNRHIRFINPVAESLLGWSLKDALGKDIEEVVTLMDSQSNPLDSPVRQALNQEAIVGIEFGARLINRHGEKIPIDDSAAPIRDEGGKVLGAVVVFRDVRDRIEMEEKLRQSEAQFRNAFDFAPVGMALVSLDNRFLQVNEAICRLLGYPEENLIGESQSHFSYSGEAIKESEYLHELLSGKSPMVQYEKRYKTFEGKDIWASVSVSLLKRDTKPICYLCQIYDLTERKAAEFQLARLAHIDMLTGLANRARLEHELEQQIMNARRYQKRLAVAFIDLDYFKQVNDSFGHEAGDCLLQAIADRLKAAVRETDTVARLGGDEFVVLLPAIHSDEEALFVIDKIRTELAKPIHITGQEMIVTVSIGVSLFPEDASDARTLLRFADSALYYAKAEGRNNLQFYRSDLTARAQQRLKRTVGLRVALERQEFELYYQPIVSLADGTLMGAEALIRWNHPELGLLLPDEFIPLAEEIGLIVPIGEWVLNQACKEAMRWSRDGGTFMTMAVNVSARQFKAGNLVESIDRAIAETGLDPTLLCVEITEQLLLKDTARNVAIISQLKARGVQIAIDDFGTGYSSLSYIKHFRPTKLKIDRSLIRNIATDAGDASIVKAAIAMANSLNLSVIIEGVETIDQKRFLQKEGCQMAQGYFYAHPSSAQEFEANLVTYHV